MKYKSQVSAYIIGFLVGVMHIFVIFSFWFLLLLVPITIFYGFVLYNFKLD